MNLSVTIRQSMVNTLNYKIPLKDYLFYNKHDPSGTRLKIMFEYHRLDTCYQ